jgi:hypothetical protein
VTLSAGATLRLPDIAQDPRSVGFPLGHRLMHSLLAVLRRSWLSSVPAATSSAALPTKRHTI